MNRSKCSLLAGDECVPLRQALDRVAELETERDALVKGMEDWARQCAEAHGVLLKMESWAAQAEAVRVAAMAYIKTMEPVEESEAMDLLGVALDSALFACPPLESVGK